MILFSISTPFSSDEQVRQVANWSDYFEESVRGALNRCRARVRKQTASEWKLGSEEGVELP